ncbi:MAG: winged helix-turn-helix transcriptional regulator [Kiritimatiellaeota bacterium]|nr:winged helix-turn-helix transcriptional regulator [Kiritimatiellota bacterium]
MTSLDPERYRELAILNHVEQTPRLNNRLAAQKLGVSVKLAHQTLRRMVAKGWLHIKKHNARRWDYFLTPSGMSEKARLTLQFLDFTLEFYREARRRSATVCRELAENGVRRVGLLGANELAEIVFLGIREWGLELAGVFDNERSGERFLRLRIAPMADLATCPAERIIVCLYDRTEPMRRGFLPQGVSPDRRFLWVFAAPGEEIIREHP